MVGLHFDDDERPALLHLHMLERGYSYARRGFVALSLPLDERDVDGFAAAVKSFFVASIYEPVDRGLPT